jgi:hypothetical protein
MPETGFTGDDDSFAALVLRHLDHATTAEEDSLLHAELREPSGAARRILYVELCRQRGQLVEALMPEETAGVREEIRKRVKEATRIRKRPAAPRRSPVWRLLAGAAAVLLAGIGYLMIAREERTLVALIERAEGAVFRTDGSGRTAVQEGESLLAGQGVETDGRGRAVLRFDDGTWLELAAQTQVRSVDTRGGKGLFVVSGSITSEVAKQPVDRPMAIRTGDGEARVVGTKFTLAAKSGETRLEVEKGLVRLTRLSDKKSVDVAAGQYALASAGQDPVARSIRPSGAALIRAMAPNSWRSIAGTAMLRVAPDAAKFPAIQGRMGARAVVEAWGGGAFDTKRKRLVLWGGGHTDYHGNEVYAFDVDSMLWERLTEPNPAPRLDSELNGDGTPNSRATYNGLAYVAHADRLLAFGGSVAGNGFASCKSTFAFDFETKTWANRAPGGALPPPDLGCTCSYDPVTRRIWWGESAGLFSYDYDANLWAKHTEDTFYYRTSVVDPKRRLWVVVGNGEVLAYDLRSDKPVRQVWKTTGGDALIKRGNPGLDYDPVRDRMVGWAGGAVYTLDPETRMWTALDAPGAPVPTPNGIYGRWRYVAGLDAFVVVTAAGEDVHFYKPGQ